MAKNDRICQENRHSPADPAGIPSDRAPANPTDTPSNRAPANPTDTPSNRAPTNPTDTPYNQAPANPADIPCDQAIAELAAAQHGVISLEQLRRLGLSASGAHHRVGRGKLHRIHHGVFAVGHPILGREGHWAAAVLACGPGAVLSHASAAALWELRPTSATVIDVTSPGRRGRGLPKIRAHSTATLTADDVTTRRGIPCTIIPRTLLDLATVVDLRGLERALEQAEILRLLDAGALRRMIAGASGRRGAAQLQALLAETANPAPTQSEFEERFLALCRSAGIPRPRVNKRIAVSDAVGAPTTIKVDFHWPDERVVVETDGYDFHRTRAAFERDRRRDQLLALNRWRPLRLTWRQLIDEPRDIAATTLGLLAQARAAADPSYEMDTIRSIGTRARRAISSGTRTS
jgi:predicted transcriptional regulator of viral defense system